MILSLDVGKQIFEISHVSYTLEVRFGRPQSLVRQIVCSVPCNRGHNQHVPAIACCTKFEAHGIGSKFDSEILPVGKKYGEFTYTDVLGGRRQGSIHQQHGSIHTEEWIRVL